MQSANKAMSKKKLKNLVQVHCMIKQNSFPEQNACVKFVASVVPEFGIDFFI